MNRSRRQSICFPMYVSHSLMYRLSSVDWWLKGFLTLCLYMLYYRPRGPRSRCRPSHARLCPTFTDLGFPMDNEQYNSKIVTVVYYICCEWSLFKYSYFWVFFTNLLNYPCFSLQWFMHEKEHEDEHSQAYPCWRKWKGPTWWDHVGGLDVSEQSYLFFKLPSLVG